MNTTRSPKVRNSSLESGNKLAGYELRVPNADHTEGEGEAAASGASVQLANQVRERFWEPSHLGPSAIKLRGQSEQQVG